VSISTWVKVVTPHVGMINLFSTYVAYLIHSVLSQGPEYMATSPIPTSPISQAMALRPSKSDSMLESKQTSSCEERRLRRDTAQSSCSSSASDLSSKDKTFAFKPISQEDDELLESGGMFEIEVCVYIMYIVK